MIRPDDSPLPDAAASAAFGAVYWDNRYMVVAERREHTMTRPDHGEPIILHGVVVHARRRTGSCDR